MVFTVSSWHRQVRLNEDTDVMFVQLCFKRCSVRALLHNVVQQPATETSTFSIFGRFPGARKQTSQSDMSKERRVLQYVLQTASRGDPDSVLAAVDKYGREKEWNMSVGDEKGAILDRFVKERAPQTMLELGTYMGYSAVRMVRLLPQGAKFITVEVNQDNAAVAKEIIAFAGLQDRIIQVLAETAEVIPQLKSKFNVESFDMVFIDHWKDFYLRDIKLLEQNKLLRKGTVVVADNIIFPGAPDYADYVRTCGKYESTFHEGKINGKKPDGMEKSVYRG
ncbi:PREDICTED: catechol O-methyltransferase-like [Branchiostoma belcheri]|uniref:catechol O-methyltransferase n=1 Tax=Branchiostoma belcheri TaxID=7741 RepID=A0A6P4ZHH5_BRABE|nr:PREDICTED: catechol O-methyltransferase-like [Branchiostoma belcheri]